MICINYRSVNVGRRRILSDHKQRYFGLYLLKQGRTHRLIHVMSLFKVVLFFCINIVRLKTLFRCARYIFKENKWLSVKVTFQRDWEVRRLRRWDRHSWSGHTGNTIVLWKMKQCCFFQSRLVCYNYCDNNDGLSYIIGHNFVTIHPSLLSVCYLCILYHQLFKKVFFFF